MLAALVGFGIGAGLVYALGSGSAPGTPGASRASASPVAAGGTAGGAAEAPAAPGRQAEVHHMGGGVMPFSLDRTTHVFEMTVTGGVQDVVVKSPADSAQIPLIRRHLSHEAERFRAGDFSDPRSLHGAGMPGVAELSAAGGALQVEYRDLPDGGRIVYSASDPEVITAIHRWFGAQLSDHGADATYR